MCILISSEDSNVYCPNGECKLIDEALYCEGIRVEQFFDGDSEENCEYIMEGDLGDTSEYQCPPLADGGNLKSVDGVWYTLIQPQTECHNDDNDICISEPLCAPHSIVDDRWVCPTSSLCYDYANEDLWYCDVE